MAANKLSPNKQESDSDGFKEYHKAPKVTVTYSRGRSTAARNTNADAGADSDPIKRPKASAGIAASRTPMDVPPTPISNERKRVGQAKSLQVQHFMAALTEDDSEASEEESNTAGETPPVITIDESEDEWANPFIETPKASRGKRFMAASKEDERIMEDTINNTSKPIIQKKRNIKWAFSCIDPSPLAFFRFTFPSHRARAFDSYGKVLESALEQCEDQVVRKRLLKMKEYNIQVHRSIREINMNVHQKFNSPVDNPDILDILPGNTDHHGREIQSIVVDEEAKVKKETVLKRQNAKRRRFQTEDTPLTSMQNRSLDKEHLRNSPYTEKITAADNNSVASASDDEYQPSSEGEPDGGDADEFKENNLSGFMETYKQMSNDKKWKLSSGTIVEDILFQNCKSDKDELLTHSWIIDLDNTETEVMFDSKDWREITNAMRPPPKVDEMFIRYSMKFVDVTTTSELRRTLSKISYIEEDKEYDRNRHYDCEWIDIVLRIMLTLWEDPNSPLEKHHLEGWYNVNIWSHIVDHGLRGIRELEIVRSEGTTTATTERKNRKRQRTGTGHRMKIGRRIDGIFQTYVSNRGFGSIEVGANFKSVTTTKWMTDSFKLAKTMHDMLAHLCQLVQSKESLVRQLEVVGLVHSELKLQVLRMVSSYGYVCILKRGDLLEIPTKAKDLQSLLKMLVKISQMKKIITNCMSIVNNPTYKTATEFYEEMVNDHQPNSPPQRIQLPWSMDTPKKCQRRK